MPFWIGAPDEFEALCPSTTKEIVFVEDCDSDPKAFQGDLKSVRLGNQVRRFRTGTEGKNHRKAL